MCACVLITNANPNYILVAHVTFANENVTCGDESYCLDTHDWSPESSEMVARDIHMTRASELHVICTCEKTATHTLESITIEALMCISEALLYTSEALWIKSASELQNLCRVHGVF